MTYNPYAFPFGPFPSPYQIPYFPGPYPIVIYPSNYPVPIKYTLPTGETINYVGKQPGQIFVPLAGGIGR
jgi:hypothetical protein